MPVEVVLPELSTTAEDIVIVTWFKKEGMEVQEGELLLEVQAEKVSFEIHAPASGHVAKILAPQGAVVKARSVVGLIAAPGEALVEEKPVEAPIARPEAKAEVFILASPAARRLAREHGIDLDLVKGSGPEGKITEQDVMEAVRKKPEAAPTGLTILERIPLAGMRKAIYDNMAKSHAQVVPVTLVSEVDMTEAVRLREEKLSEWDREGIRPTINDVVLKAAAMTLAEDRRLNASLAEGELRIWREINIGLAVAVEDGLVVPVIRGADRKSLPEIAKEARELAEQARGRKLRPQDLEGATFTVTNLGAFGITAFTPIIPLPQIAILGVGMMEEKPVIRDGQVVPRQVMNLCLVFDHRAIDGAQAAQFLQKVKATLEAPSTFF
ncbi:MAG: 2-oxo acid dehydrogenase subunit E2 [candidate division NC10 bacterium]|nr:2-oxo acid dehydrogenase subunit E2 [candidate division NC10 bacterium]